MYKNDRLHNLTDTGWIEQVSAWTNEALEKLGMHVTGELEEVRVKPWATVLRLSTDRGRVYFKACHEALSNEVALTQALYRWRPDCMVQVLAYDLEKSWMLMADEGEMLRLRIQSPDDLWHWHSLLPLFAGVQIEMAERQDELLRLGLIDRRIERLPAMLENMVADRAMLRVGKADGLSEAQAERLLTVAPLYREMCSRLAGYPIPMSLHHDDFHNSNVYTRDGRYTFSDWGDSLLTHPFFSMIITLRSISDLLGLPDEATEVPEQFPAELNYLRDLYLEPWTRFASMDTLHQVFPLAWRVGMVSRALSWYQYLKEFDEPRQEEFGYTVPAWLSEFLLTI